MVTRAIHGLMADFGEYHIAVGHITLNSGCYKSMYSYATML